MELTGNLFDDVTDTPSREAIGGHAFVLRGFARSCVPDLLLAIAAIERVAPFRQMVTPGGLTMSVGLTNCGQLGWTTDRRGYRYSAVDPQTGQPWPPMPELFLRLARDAAQTAGFDGFVPDACLVNRYRPGTRLSLHQDKDERDFDAPVVSVSLGIPAVFQFGGHKRADRPLRIPLFHGDMVVWGGVDRLRFHGVLPLTEDHHPLLGDQRVSFTLRKAG
jgi:alkylated DNA repair protein (DNA oxidative demethylase)